MELSPEEEAKQLALLTRVRQHHHHLLVNSKVARRILDADIPVNFMKNSDEFTEGTLLYPIRKKLANMAIGVLWGGERSLINSCKNLPQDMVKWVEFAEEYPKSDVVMLGRIEPHSHGYSVATAYANIQLERGETGKGILPLDGIHEDDASLLTELLHEVENFQVSGELSCLDPESLLNYTIGRHGPAPMP